ncbi:MAG: glycerol kinase GlpK [Lacibacter sp.]
MEKFILAFDQGTTSSRALVFDQAGNVRAMAQKEFTQLFPQPGWVEHDPEEIWSTQLGVAAEAVSRAGLTADQIHAIGITNQRETTLVWDRHTGKPVYNAIVWQDRRTADFCEQLHRNNLHHLLRQRTGLVADAYFSATKIRWILDHVAGARKKAEQGDLCFGTVDTWLLWKLTRGQVHSTDVSNASRTLLMNLQTCRWDEDLLRIFDIPASLLPQIRSSSEVYGNTRHILSGVSIPIAGIAGDQQAALFGQQCTRPGMVKNTYGTGCFMLMHTGTQPVQSDHRLLTTVAWQLNGVTEYALEGSVFVAGAVVQWLRDGLGVIRHAAEVETLAAQVPHSDGVYLVPAFAGLGAPWWNPHARGTIVGMTRGTTAAHIARAALDSIAFQTADVLRAMEADAGIAIGELRVDGGATVNNTLLQFQADLLQTTVVRPRIIETTALGAAFLAGLATGYWNSTAELQQQWQAERRFAPSMDAATRNSLLEGWARAIRAAQAF